MSWFVNSSIKKSLVLFFISATIFITFFTVIKVSQEDRITIGIRTDAINATTYITELFEEKLIDITQDTFSYASLLEAELELTFNESIDFSNNLLRFKPVLEAKPEFYSLSVLDADKVELAKLVHRNDEHFLLNSNELIDQSNNPYYAEIEAILGKNVYISTVDFYGLQSADKPVTMDQGIIHFIVPFSIDETRYYFVLDYYAEDLIRNFQESINESDATARASHLDIFNEMGYYIYTSNAEINTLLISGVENQTPYSYLDHYDFIQPIEEANAIITQYENNNSLYTTIKLNSYMLNQTLDQINKGTIGIHTFGSVAIFNYHVHYDEITSYQDVQSAYIGMIVVSLMIAGLIGYFSYRSFEKNNSILTRLHIEARRDILTQLPNRTGILEDLEKYILDEIDFALLFIDYDNFKNLNDTYGHHIGDLALQYGTKRIKSTVREQDILARIGGDEFILALIGVHSMEQAESIIQKIMEALKAPFLLDNHTINLRVSIGATISDGTKTIDDLLLEADKVMYDWKESKKMN